MAVSLVAFNNEGISSLGAGCGKKYDCFVDPCRTKPWPIVAPRGGCATPKPYGPPRGATCSLGGCPRWPIACICLGFLTFMVGAGGAVCTSALFLTPSSPGFDEEAAPPRLPPPAVPVRLRPWELPP